MASRIFNRYQALEKEVKTLYAEVAIGTTGAPTLTKGLGIASIARTGTGTYTITMEDKYVRLMHVAITELNSSTEDITTQLKSQDMSAKTIEFFTKTAGAAADAADGSTLYIKMEMKNSTSGE